MCRECGLTEAPHRRPVQCYSVTDIKPDATAEETKWLVEAVVHKCLELVADPRLGEMRILHYATGPREQIRAIWTPAGQ